MDGGEVAYKVVGDGPLDLLHFFGVGSHVEELFRSSLQESYISTLASFTRLIAFDRRGTGASDRMGDGGVATWEDGVADVLGVMDAVGTERAALLAGFDGGPVAMQVAVRHPDRVQALVLANTLARYLVADDHPIGSSEEQRDAVVRRVERLWGTDRLASIANPDPYRDGQALLDKARAGRSSMTPRAAAAQMRYALDQDARPLLAQIQAPTLVFHTTANPLFQVEHGRHLAASIPHARLVELPGDGVDYDIVAADTILDALSEFLTGEPMDHSHDRVSATLLFTDIVDSTGRLASLGDGRWGELLDAHDSLVRARLREHGGHEVKQTGDGFLARFDDPLRAVRCALAIREIVRTLGVEVRAGIHTGECTLRRGDLAGLAVHVAARVGALAGPGHVLVTASTRDLVTGSGLTFASPIEAELRGLVGTWALSEVVGEST